MDCVKVLMVSGTDTNLGKTTIAKNLKDYFKNSFDQDCLIMSIEKPEAASDGEDKRFYINDSINLSDVIEDVMFEFTVDKSVILDVGGDSFDRVMAAIRDHSGVVEEMFDYFLVPIHYAIKEERLVMRIGELIDQGVKPQKIFIIANNISATDLSTTPLAVKYPLLAALHEEGVTLVDEAIMKSQLVSNTRGRGPVSAYLPTKGMSEYKDEMKKAIEEGNTPLAKSLASQVGQMGLAKSTHKSFTNVFDKIFER